MNFESFVEWAALNNAVRYGGRASASALLGSIFAQFPEWRGHSQEILPKVQAIVEIVNATSADRQAARLAQLGGPKEQVKKREGLKPLPSATKGKVVMRIAPSPSGALHIGHAYTLLLSHIYCKEWDGRFILRIEDTAPDNIYPPAYDLIERDTRWLTRDRVDQVVLQSDRVELYYSYAERCLREGWAYVCLCPSDLFRELSRRSDPCPCRDLSPSEHLLRWEGMLTDAPQGSAVVRIKTDLMSPNPALRDWPALRINEFSHPRTQSKYRVWPLMNFSVAVDDMELGMTHVLRGKDHADNAKKQEFLYTYFKRQPPTTLFVGRINFEGFRVSASETRQKIVEGLYQGWDDIRLPFIPALRRRGYQPGAFERYAVEVGISTNDKSVEIGEFFKSLNAFNKELVDKDADRFFLVLSPVELTVERGPERTVELDRHPDLRKGGRRFTVHRRILLAKKDHDALREGQLYRLKDLYNVRWTNGSLIYVSDDLEEYRASGAKILHWLPAGDALVRVEYRRLNNEVEKGVAEPLLGQATVDTILQAERVGFLRVDDEGETVKLWELHQ